MEDVYIHTTVEDCAVIFLHAEGKDEEGRARAFKHTLKHIKWVAGKGQLKNVVLHSFTHLGGDTGNPQFALEFMEELRERLTNTGYNVSMTPFGYFCSWSIDVRGESMAKVWKSI